MPSMGGGALAPPPRRCAAPPASPPGSGPGSPVGPAGAPRPTASLPGPAGQGFVLVGPLVVGPLVAQPLRGARGPPGPVRFACAAAPARPRWGPSPRCGIGFGAPPAVRGLPCRWPGPGLGLLAELRLGGRGCPLWGGPSSRLVPRSGLVPAPLRSALLVVGRASRCCGGGRGFSPAPSRPAVPAGDSGKPEARLGGLRPPSALRSAPPVGRASRAPLRHPAPVGAGPRGPLFGAVVNPEIVNPPRVRPVRVPSDRFAGPHIPAARPAFTACPAPGASPFFPSGAARGLTSYAKRDMLMFRGPFHSFRGVAASAVSTDGKKSPPNFQGGDFSYSEPSQPCRN